MGRKRIKADAEPKTAKWLKVKFITSGGDITKLVKELPKLKVRGIKVDALIVGDNTIELNLRTSKPSLFLFVLHCARFSISNSISFKCVFKDNECSLDWCGYYETNPTSTIEGSRFTNQTKLNQMLKTYFSIL